MKYTKTIKRFAINYNEKNMDNSLKESMFFSFLQDVATKNADENNFGYSELSKQNLGWFLLKYRIELDNYPQNTDFIEIETYSRGAMKIFAMRDFIIYSSQHKIIGKIASCWGLIDMQAKSMVPVQKHFPDLPTYKKEETDLLFNKIHIPDSFDYEKTFEVRFDDIDINQHANNTNYIVWGLEALPCSFRRSHKIKNIDIVFKKDILVNEFVLSQVKVEDNKTTHILSNKATKEDLCNICIEWV